MELLFFVQTLTVISAFSCKRSEASSDRFCASWRRELLPLLQGDARHGFVESFIHRRRSPPHGGRPSLLLLYLASPHIAHASSSMIAPPHLCPPFDTPPPISPVSCSHQLFTWRPASSERTHPSFPCLKPMPSMPARSEAMVSPD
jgi:hypothetical protein